MIKVLYEEGRYAPVIVCDVCGERIKDAENGAAVSNSDPDILSDGDVVGVRHAHKGNCHDQAEQVLRDQGVHPGWNSLHKHLVQALQSTGLTLKNIEKYFK